MNNGDIISFSSIKSGWEHIFLNIFTILITLRFFL